MIVGPLNGTEYTLPAMDATVGTFPLGSEWRRNPIPACNCDKGFACKFGADDMTGEEPCVLTDGLLHLYLSACVTMLVVGSYFNGTQPEPEGYDCATG